MNDDKISKIRATKNGTPTGHHNRDDASKPALKAPHANDDRTAKLQTAIDDARSELVRTKTAHDESLRRLDAAKELLRNMDPEDQAKIQINDTKLPELIDLHAAAIDAYRTAKKRFETNVRYLGKVQAAARGN